MTGPNALYNIYGNDILLSCHYRLEEVISIFILIAAGVLSQHIHRGCHVNNNNKNVQDHFVTMRITLIKRDCEVMSRKIYIKSVSMENLTRSLYAHIFRV